jgi:Divergent InlB B-repeat domain
MAIGTRLAAVLCAVGAVALGSPAVARAETWCGNDAVATNRLPETFTGKQIHVVYAFPADGGDRFASLASPIATDIAAIDAWWRSKDPTRTPRFDQFAFPGCGPGMGRLDLTRAQLPRPAAEYFDLATTLSRLRQDLSSQPFGFGLGYSKYLVYYDGPVSEGACGQAYVLAGEGGRNSYAAVYLGASRCGGDLGDGARVARTTAHEIGHALGAVPREAPNLCEAVAHTCDYFLDLMANVNVGAPLSGAVLDYGNDDYYNHSGGWWDVRDSPWLFRLDQPQQRLQVVVAGSTGGSTVLSGADDPGIACPPACAADWDAGSTVPLEYELQGNDRFVGWRGGCSGTETACAVVMDGPKTVTAVFGPPVYRLAVTVVGRGTVRTSDGARCSRRCALRLEPGSAVRLTAKPARGFRFVRWGGSCRGARACVVRGSAHRSVTAVFRRR